MIISTMNHGHETAYPLIRPVGQDADLSADQSDSARNFGELPLLGQDDVLFQWRTSQSLSIDQLIQKLLVLLVQESAVSLRRLLCPEKEGMSQPPLHRLAAHE